MNNTAFILIIKLKAKPMLPFPFKIKNKKDCPASKNPKAAGTGIKLTTPRTVNANIISGIEALKPTLNKRNLNSNIVKKP